MTAWAVVAIPAAANAIGAWLVIRHGRPAIRTVLLANLAGSILLGALIAVKVACCSAEPSLWPMPLLFAPLEYWWKFGVAAMAVAVILHVLRRKAEFSKNQNHF